MQASNRAMKAMLAGGSMAMICLFESAGCQDRLEKLDQLEKELPKINQLSAVQDDNDLDASAMQERIDLLSEQMKKTRIDRNKSLICAAAGMGLFYVGWNMLE